MNPDRNTKRSKDVYTEFQQTLAALQSNVNDLSTLGDFSNRTLLENSIEGLEKGSTNHLSQLKRCLNALTPINRLPEELLSLIIRLSASPTMSNLHPYLKYTWVCHHWRSVLVNNAEFWTLICYKNASSEVFREFIVRSKSAKLDVIITPTLDISELMDFFVAEGSRVRRLGLPNHGDVHKLDFEAICFPSLRKMVLYELYSYPGDTNHTFLPSLVASEGLETLEYGLSGHVPLDKALSVFSRVRSLSVDIRTVELLRSFLSLLHKCPKLQALRVTYSRGRSDDETSEPIHLPELKTLLTNIPVWTDKIRAPRLSNLFCMPPRFTVERFSILDSFDLSSMKYLYLRCFGSRHHGDHPPRMCNDQCIVGSQERMRCRHFHMRDSATTVFEDFVPPNHDCFHFTLPSQGYQYQPDAHGFQAILSSIVPRLINLVELRVLVPHPLVNVRAILSMASSLQILIIKCGDKLLNFIKFFGDPSLCPQLNELSYSTLKIPRNREKYALDVGKKLIKCLRLRKNGLVHPPQIIILKHCPPLPNDCLEELLELKTTVTTWMSDQQLERPPAYPDKFSDIESY